MGTPIRVTDLTVDQLQRLIKKTVQESVAEVMLEFLMTAQIEGEIALEAELVEAVHGARQRKAKRKRDTQSLKLDD